MLDEPVMLRKGAITFLALPDIPALSLLVVTVDTNNGGYIDMHRPIELPNGEGNTAIMILLALYHYVCCCIS